MSKVCQYFFSMHSPWAYLGHERFVAIARENGVQVEVRPLDLSRVLAVSGGLPLAKRAPQRQAYRLVELKRWSNFLGLTLNLQPKVFPVPPISQPSSSSPCNWRMARIRRWKSRAP